MVTWGYPRSLSDIDLSTEANDPAPSASCSARKILNVFQRIHLTFFLTCGLASGGTSFASSRRHCRTDSSKGGLTSWEDYHDHHTVETLKTQDSSRCQRRAPFGSSPNIACAGYLASGILLLDAWISGRLFFGACSNIYGSDSRRNRISRRS